MFKIVIIFYARFNKYVGLFVCTLVILYYNETDFYSFEIKEGIESQTLEDIQQRMAILQPNPELEKEFKELREIRQQYIKLERNLLEKKEMWETLNKDD